ncbi:hypothetical protein GW17_00056918, partial [Ensete ventricosum]
LNQDVRRTRPTPRLAAYKPLALSTSDQLPQPKKFTREELHDRSVKGLCWHCDKPWSCDHRYKKGRLLLIKPTHESEQEEEDLKHEENTEEDLQPTDCMPSVTILIDIGSINNFMNSKCLASNGCPR